MSELIVEHRDRILEAWLAKILHSFPEQAAKFMRHHPNPFANPVGTTFRSRAERILSAMLDGSQSSQLSLALEDILKIRAVQELSAAESVGFVFQLRAAIVEVLEDRLSEPEALREIIRFSQRVDAVALEAFELFTKSRERVFELRVKELKRTGFRLLKRAGPAAGGSESDRTSSGPGEVQ